MNQLRQHIVCDLSTQISTETRAALQRHISVLQHGGVSPAEGVAILTVAAAEIMTFIAGAATILADPQDVGAAFDRTVKAINTGAGATRDNVVASLSEAIARMRLDMRAAQS